MATLEKIRKRQVFLFTVIIVALVAFIIGDGINSAKSFFGPGSAAAKVDGHKIDYQQFNNRLEQMRQELQNRGYNSTDLAVLQQEVLGSMVYETLLQEEYKKLGLVVTDNELSQAMLGQTALPGIVQQVQQTFGVATPDQLHDMAFNPTKYQIPAETASQLQNAWTQMEKDVEKQLLQNKLANLFIASLVANKLDAKDLYDQNSLISDVAFAKVDYSSLPDEEFTPTKEEINSKYNELKSRFRLQQPVRKVNYISVDIKPSTEDITKAQQDVEAAIELLNSQEGVEGLSGLFVTNNMTNKKSAFSNAIAGAIDSLQVGQAKLVSFANNTYTIAKLLGKNEAQADSVRYDVGVISVAGAEQRDSLINALNAGADLEAVTGGQFNKNASVSLIGAEAAAFKDLIAGAPVGKYFTPDTAATANQVRVIRVNGYSAPVNTYEVAEITYQVDPSTTTVNNLRQGLVDFIAANNTAEKFAAGATQAGFNIFPAEVTSSSLSLANIPETRGAVKWVLKAKKGQVSDVKGDEQTGRFIAVALNDIYKDYIPVTEPAINLYITDLVKNDKKAAKLIADFKGKGSSVASYAQAMNTKVDTAAVAFGQAFVNGFPFNENDFIAAVAAAGKGKLTGPVQSNSAVVVFQVNDVKNEGREFDFKTDGARFNQTAGATLLGQNLYNILLGKNIIESNILNFYREEGE